MGTANHSFVDLTELIGRKTGGVSVAPFASSFKGKVEDPHAYIMVSPTTYLYQYYLQPANKILVIGGMRQIDGCVVLRGARAGPAGL